MADTVTFLPALICSEGVKFHEDVHYRHGHVDAVHADCVSLPRLHHELYGKGSRGNGSIGSTTAAAAADTYNDLHNDQEWPLHRNSVQLELRVWSMSSDLYGRLLSQIEQLRRNILEQRLALERIDLAVVMLFQEIRAHNRGRLVPPAED